MLSRNARTFRFELKRGFRHYSSAPPKSKYPIGSKISGYVVDRVEQIPEFNMTAVELTHSFSGSKHLHIDRQDKNNVFGVVVKTNPPDNSGLPHMLEHTTLCGSQKYPIRDPFFKMLNRSLANFMNAMTGYDYTYFPFATTNKVDYNNLMDIYLDSVFHPLLKREDFSQEGWRLEHAIPQDKKSPLVFKGVVYNEMKGQISDPSYYFWIKFQQSIYPSLYNSGGNPPEIINSYYDDLLDFHERHYHPSNCWTYTYGSFPLEPSLEKIGDTIKTFGKRHRKLEVRKPIELEDIEKVEIAGPVDPMHPKEKQYKASLTWYTGTPNDNYESFLLKVLSTLLMDGHSSPMYQSLVEGGIGSDFSSNSGMDGMAAVNLFSIGLNGLTKKDSDQLEDHVLSCLKKVQAEGFPKNRVDAILHQLELGRKIESANFGLGLLSSIAPGLGDGVDPLVSLKWGEVLDRFRKEYAAQGSKLFQNLIEKYLVSKPYFKYVMRPDEKVPDRLAKQEQKTIKERESKMTTSDKEIIYKHGLDLQKLQKGKKENLSCLPTLHIDDINREGGYPRVREILKSGVPLQTRVSPKANGVTYFRALKTLSKSDIPYDLIKYLPLFSTCLTNLGTKTESISEIEDQVKLYTAGLGSGSFVHSSPLNPDEAYLKFSINSACLDKNVPKMLEIWQKLLLETNFRNIEKLQVLVKSLISDNLSAIVSSGHSFASSFAGSKLSSVGKLQESLSGIEQVRFLNHLGKVTENNELETEIVPKLEHIAELFLRAPKFKYGLTCSRKNEIASESSVLKFDDKFNASKPFTLDSYKLEKLNKSHTNGTFVEIPSQTNFASSVIRGDSYISEDAASLQLLSQMLTFTYLHKEIREQGGAYGGGAMYDALNGLFSFYSYRDPKPFESEQKFVESTKVLCDKIADKEITDQDLEQAKLTIFQKIDAPESVREEGLANFNYGVDDDMRQERREALLDCTIDNIKEVVGKYFTPSQTRSNAIIGSSGSNNPGTDQNNWLTEEL